MSGRRAQQLSTLWIFAPVAQDHLEGAKAAVSERQQAERDNIKSAAPIHFSVHDKRESRCQSTSVALPGALFLVSIHTSSSSCLFHAVEQTF